MGRPSKYKTIDLKQVEKLAGYGLIDTQIADIVGISDRALYNYEKEFPEFLQSIKKGKEISDAKVVKSLYQRACGYSHPDVHISNYQGEITVTPLTKHYPPDTLACIYWTKNRMPKEWRDRQEFAHSLEDFLYAENEGKSISEIQRESNLLAEAIMAKRKGISLPSEN